MPFKPPSVNPFETSTRMIKGRANALFDSFHDAPKLGVAAIAAGIAAPFFLDNDQRGFLKTSMVTAPVIGAAFMAAPYLRASVDKHAAGATTIFRNMPSKFRAVAKAEHKEWIAPNYPTMARMQKEFFSGNSNVGDLSKEAGAFFFRTKSRIPNVQSEAHSLITQLGKSLNGFHVIKKGQKTFRPGRPELGHYYINSAHASQLRTLSASELVQKGLRTLPEGITGEPYNYLVGLINEQASKGNYRFIREMTSRVQQANKKKFIVGGSYTTPSTLGAPRYTSYNLDKASFEIIEKLKKQDPALFKEIREAQRKGTLNPAKLNILVSNEASNKIIGMQYSYGEREVLPISVLQDNGLIFGGHGFSRGGAPRMVWDTTGTYRSDLFAIRNLGKGYDSLSKELPRINILNFVDESESWSSYTPRFGESIVDGSSIPNKLISKMMIANQIGGFNSVGNKERMIKASQDVGFAGMNAREMEEAIVSRVASGGGIIVGSGSNLMKGVLASPELRQLNWFGITDPQKANAWARSLTKPMQLVPKYNTNAIYPTQKPFALTDYVRNLPGKGEVLPTVGITTSGLTPMQVSFFSELPASVKDLDSYSPTAVSKLMEKEGLNQGQAEKAWAHMKDWLSQEDNLEHARHARYIGEGTIVTPNELGGGLESAYFKHVQVHELSDNVIPGTILEPNTVLGSFFGDTMHTVAPSTEITNITDLGNGEHSIALKELYPVRSGAKAEVIGGQRGLLYSVHHNAFDKIKEAFSQYNLATGTGTNLPTSAHSLSIANFFRDSGDPVQQYMSMADYTMRKLRSSNQGEMAEKYVSKLLNVGVTELDGQLVYESAQGFKALTNHESRVAEFEKARKIVDDMFNEVSEKVKSGELNSIETWENYKKLQSVKPTSFANYLLDYELPGNLTVWHDNLLNQPDRVKVTYDMLDNLYNSGHNAIARDISGRMKYPQDPRLTRRVMDYLSNPNATLPDGSPVIDKTMTLSEAMNGRNDWNLSTAVGRENTIFDPGHKIASTDNFLLDLGDRKIPVLSHAAHGGKINRYGTEFSGSETEQHLSNVIKAYQRNKSTVDKTKVVEDYLDHIKTYGYGKNSYLRAEAFDDHAEASYIFNRASDLRYEDGSINPFQAGISRNVLDKFADKDVRRRLLAGESVPMTMGRHPISDMPIVEAVFDPNIKTNAIGLSPQVQALLRGDVDQDPVYAFPILEQNAVGEAKKAIYDRESLQSVYLDRFIADRGAKMKQDLVPIATHNEIGRSNIKARLSKWMNNAGRDVEAARARTTMGVTGRFSDINSKLEIALLNSNTVTDAVERKALRNDIFDVVRQMAISSGKLKDIKNLSMSYSQGMQMADVLDKSIKPSSNFNVFYNTLNSLAQYSGEHHLQNLEKNKELLQKFHSGITEQDLQAASALLSSRAGDISITSKSRNKLAFISGASRETAYEGGRAANMSAEAIGAINDTLKAGRKVAEDLPLASMKKSLLLGLGLAAGAGLLTTSLKSGHDITPEKNISGQDIVSSDPVSGSMAPSGPRRNVVMAPSGVRTSIVAPINRSNHVDVTIQTDDPNKTLELSKAVSRLSGQGNVNTTVNYRRGQDINTLYGRQKIKDAMDQKNE